MRKSRHGARGHARVPRAGRCANQVYYIFVLYKYIIIRLLYINHMMKSRHGARGHARVPRAGRYARRLHTKERLS